MCPDGYIDPYSKAIIVHLLMVVLQNYYLLLDVIVINYCLLLIIIIPGLDPHHVRGVTNHVRAEYYIILIYTVYVINNYNKMLFIISVYVVDLNYFL